MDVGVGVSTLIDDSFGVDAAESAGCRGSFGIVRSCGERWDVEEFCGIYWCICTGDEGWDEGGGDVVDCCLEVLVSIGGVR